MCPECGSSKVRVEPYDYGVCRETGYQDAGERYACQDCGATGDADDLATQSPRHSAVESIGTSSAAAGGALPSGAISLAF
jgi:rubredoxin